ncbi:MAG: RNA polymerase sigma-70 factor [Prolixibacteraceae bacterium]
MNPTPDPNLFDAIRNDDRQAFERLFREFYRPLTAYAFRFVRDLPTAENIIQDVYLKLWQNRSEIIITTSLEHYLFRSVRNHSLNQLDKSKVRTGYLRMQIGMESDQEDYSSCYPEPGLLDKIEAAISALPAKRQEIFRMAREEGLKYREIADKLNLSVKTVEAQMSLALKQLRESLKEFHPHVLFLMLSGKGISGLACHGGKEVVGKRLERD